MRGKGMETELKIVHWKGKKFWVGKLLEYPDIMTQGKTLKEFEGNMKEAYVFMTMEDALKGHKVKKITFA